MTDHSSKNMPCKDAGQHPLHICQLAKKGLKEEITHRTGHPEFICHNCNTTANQADDLCNPSPYKPK
jgi:hypothetical protein